MPLAIHSSSRFFPNLIPITLLLNQRRARLLQYVRGCSVSLQWWITWSGYGRVCGVFTFIFNIFRYYLNTFRLSDGLFLSIYSLSFRIKPRKRNATQREATRRPLVEAALKPRSVGRLVGRLVGGGGCDGRALLCLYNCVNLVGTELDYGQDRE